MASVMANCDRCGSATPAGASVCPNCGAPLGGVDASVTGVSPETVRSDFPERGAGSAQDWPPLGTQMPVGGQAEPPRPASPWQEALPPVEPAPPAGPRPSQQVFDTPPSAAAPVRRFPWPWIIGCCLIIALLACLLAIGLAGWLFTAPSFS